MHEFGTTSEQLAQIAVSTREWAALNPRARYRDPLTVDDVLASPLQVSPLHLLDCCLVTDGAGAFVMTSAERARSLSKPPVYVLGAATCTDHMGIGQMPDLTTTPGRGVGRQGVRHGGTVTLRRRRPHGLRQLHHHGAPPPRRPRFLQEGRGRSLRRGGFARTGPRPAGHEHERRRPVVHPSGHVRHVPHHRGGAPAARRVRRAPGRRRPGGGRPRLGHAPLGHVDGRARHRGRRCDRRRRACPEPLRAAGRRRERALLGGDPPGAAPRPVVHGVQPRRVLPAGVLPPLRRARLVAGMAHGQRAGDRLCRRGREPARGRRGHLLRWRALLCGPGRPGGGGAHDDERRRLPARRCPQRHGRDGDLGAAERRPAAAAVPARTGHRTHDPPRGQAPGGGPGHAARVVGGSDPGPPGGGDPARRPHLRGPERRHQPPRPGAAGSGPAGGRLPRADVHQPPRVPRGPLRLAAHGAALHPHQLAPHGPRGRLHRRELRGQGVRLLGRARRQGRRRRGCGRPRAGQDQHGRLPPRLRDVQQRRGRRGRLGHRRPGARHPDALHLGHHGPTQGRAPRLDGRQLRWPPSTSAATTRTG